eukprot:scaffold13367_cov21-Tisochrysis_lutea.AAC.1
MTQTFQHILPVSKPWHDKGQCSLAFAKHAHAGEHARAHHTHTHTHTHRHKYKHVLGAKLTMCIWTDVLELVCMPVRMCRYGPRAGGGRDDPERSTASNGAQVRAAPQPFTAGSTAAGSASAGEGAVCFKATMRGLLVRGAGGNPSRSPIRCFEMPGWRQVCKRGPSMPSLQQAPSLPCLKQVPSLLL